jgi:hypothetical protein
MSVKVIGDDGALIERQRQSGGKAPPAGIGHGDFSQYGELGQCFGFHDCVAISTVATASSWRVTTP